MGFQFLNAFSVPMIFLSFQLLFFENMQITQMKNYKKLTESKVPLFEAFLCSVHVCVFILCIKLGSCYYTSPAQSQWAKDLVCLFFLLLEILLDQMQHFISSLTDDRINSRMHFCRCQKGQGRQIDTGLLMF